MLTPAKNTTLVIGIFGLFITLALNIVSYFALGYEAANIANEQWTSNWLPSYIVWTVFTTIGLSERVLRKL